MMDLIKKLNTLPPTLAEDAAGSSVGAGSIGAVGLPLFAKLVNRTKTASPRLIKYGSVPVTKKTKKGIGLKEAFASVHEDFPSPKSAADNFDSGDVISKLKSLENKESTDYRDTVSFGLVDANGGIVKVTVPSDQGQSFEQDIQHFLGDTDEAESAPEIAEVLFKMKDRYTIITVDWPQVEEDQEEGQLLDPTTGEAQPGDEVPPAEGELGAEGEQVGDELGGAPAQDTGSVETLLTQVIDMMRADADARKAEAQAREAEAKTKQAGAAREQAMARVKQEEQFLDMDEYDKNKRTEEKEAKRLAQLAKWKHNMANNDELPAQKPQYDFLPGEEDEELFRSPSPSRPQHPNKGAVVRGRVSPADVAKYILDRNR